jgi:ribosome modulation factor
MINKQQEKIAYAEGYHSGMMGEQFDNPYEDFDLRVQFNYGYRMATDRIDSLIANHLQEA